MKNVFKNIGLLAAVLALAYVFSYSGGSLYLKIFSTESAGSFLDGTALIGLPLAYIFFLTIIFTAFGDKNKYVLLIFLLLPAALVEIFLDARHLILPILIFLVAWLIGFALNLLIKTLKKSLNTAKSKPTPLTK